MNFMNSLEFAQQSDKADKLSVYRQRFLFPQHNGQDVVYFTGNSLGLQPKTTQSYIQQELEDWAKQTPYIASLQRRIFPDQSSAAIAETLVAALVKAGAAQRDGNMVVNKD